MLICCVTPSKSALEDMEGGKGLDPVLLRVFLVSAKKAIRTPLL